MIVCRFANILDERGMSRREEYRKIKRPFPPTARAHPVARPAPPGATPSRTSAREAARQAARYPPAPRRAAKAQAAHGARRVCRENPWTLAQRAPLRVGCSPAASFSKSSTDEAEYRGAIGPRMGKRVDEITVGVLCQALQ